MLLDKLGRSDTFETWVGCVQCRPALKLEWDSVVGIMEQMILLPRIRRRWQLSGVPIRAGATPRDIEAFERRHGVRLPADMRTFYSMMDGMEYGRTDETLICFWPLNEVDTVGAKLSGWRGIPDYRLLRRQFPGAAHYFAFADYLVWSHVYAVRIADDSDVAGPVVWLDGNWGHIADSFTGFLERYLADPESILFPDE